MTSLVWALSFSNVFFGCVYSSMEFLAKSAANEGPLVAFGGSDGVIRVLSMITLKVCFLTALLSMTSCLSCIVVD